MCMGWTGKHGQTCNPGRIEYRSHTTSDEEAHLSGGGFAALQLVRHRSDSPLLAQGIALRNSRGISEKIPCDNRRQAQGCQQPAASVERLAL